MGRLNQASHIDLGFPHDYLDEDAIQQVIYGDTVRLIDNHRAG